MMIKPGVGDIDFINQLSPKISKSYLKNIMMKTCALSTKASSVKPFEEHEVSKFGRGDRDLINQLSLNISKSYIKNLMMKTCALPVKALSVQPFEGWVIHHHCDGGMINIPLVFDHVMTSLINGVINHGISAVHHDAEALIVPSLMPYAAALLGAISMMIFAFGKVSCQFTILTQSGRKMMMPFPITLAKFIFIAFLTCHCCVFGYDKVGDNHCVVQYNIRGTDSAATVKPNGSDIDIAMITKLVRVRKIFLNCIIYCALLNLSIHSSFHLFSHTGRRQ